ncbi:tripartite motif-containing protein 45-like isoform X2 [Ostrea edulis]|uniref:tripartite motif-containing protein 45-like isoform X2 n=1 Tax=Ostrea edulis TaxID=37623 RepID=UPI0024AFCCE9|nr:tripartite motif-containing protein 45-like isoform X2 [Ostrea edulis]
MDAEDQNECLSGDEEISRLPGSDSAPCTMCVEEPDSTAVIYCDECQEKMCEMCAFFHGRLRRTQHHQLTDIQNSGGSQRKHYLSCLERGRKDVSMNETLVNHISEEMNSKVLLFDRLIQRCDDVEMESNQLSQDIEKEINFHFDNYIESLEKHRIQLQEQVRAISTRHNDDIISQKSELCNFKENVDEVYDILRSMNSDDVSSDWSRLSKLLLTIRRANVQVSALEMSFCPDSEGPVIDNYQFYGQLITGHVSPAKCFINHSGLDTARVRHKLSILLHVIQEEGKPYPCSAEIRARILDPSGCICLPREAKNNLNGTWTLEFLPCEAGKHVLYVTVNGHPIKTKSFVFHVKHGWREHTGRWHCCSACSGNKSDYEQCTYGSHLTDDFLCNHSSVIHPEAPHWSCCGKLTRHSECDVLTRTKTFNQTKQYTRPISKCSIDLDLINSAVKEVTL